MTVKRLVFALLAATLLAPGVGAAADRDYGMPRAMPNDYAAAEGHLPRAMPSDYARAGVTPSREDRMPRAMPADYDAYFGPERKPVGAIDWSSAGIGAGIALGAVLAAALLVGQIRRHLRGMRPATFTALALAVFPLPLSACGGGDDEPESTAEMTK